MRLHIFVIAIFFILLSQLTLAASDKLVKGHWDGELYSQNAVLQSGWAESFFFNHYQFKGSETVLDIGSGDGKTTARIAEKVKNVIGIDNSERMIQKAYETFGKIDNIEFIMTDALDKQFYKKNVGKFDLVTSFLVAHWVDDNKLLLENIYTGLKKGGIFYIKKSSKSFDPSQDLADTLAKSPKYKEYFKDFSDPMNRHSLDEYYKLVKAAGFDVLSIADTEERDVFKNKHDVSTHLMSWLPHYHHLRNKDEKLAQSYVNEIVDRYVSQYPADKQGNITLIDHYLEVIAKKNI
jgi:SAM-dependent methyltransferase